MNVQDIKEKYFFDAPAKYKYVIYLNGKPIKRGTTNDADYDWQVKGLAFGIKDWDKISVLDKSSGKEVRSLSKNGEKTGSFSAPIKNMTSASSKMTPTGNQPSQADINLVTQRRDILIRTLGEFDNLRAKDPKVKIKYQKAKNEYESLLRWKDRIEPMFKMEKNPLYPRRDWDSFKAQMTDVFKEIERQYNQKK